MLMPPTHVPESSRYSQFGIRLIISRHVALISRSFISSCVWPKRGPVDAKDAPCSERSWLPAMRIFRA